MSAESFSRMPAELLRLARDDPHRPAPHPGEAGDDGLRELGLHVEDEPVVDDATDHLVHVVGLAVRVGKDVEQVVVHPARRVGGLAQRRGLLAVLREEREVVLDRLDALLVRGHLEVGHARLAAVDARAAELLLRHVLAGDGLHEMRSRERHRPTPLHHRHEVGQARDVGGAGRAGSHQRRDLGDHPAHHDLLPEEEARAREQRAHRLLDPRARGVEQPHERDPLRQRELPQPRHLQLPGHAHRAGHDREVVRADGHHPPLDLPVSRHHAVGRRLLALHRALREVRAGRGCRAR